ncbi:Na+/H+ antiporter NhaC [Aromatoleum petrolei]|uniref:Na+/H+ antiporter NhaC n=1 Tax=Aromatoleum petrolei TaxID=76116 RepID=A0ABX1MN48_9RHOO|nr:Na+/H+ antiporter NhaC [Aromatoleum petrolei]NMF89374.1 Na+/H+ antiporter NhaC [Aromatoleum petrolei]QTQ39103.1 putative Na+/H+ antiporter [Aromatoleum petrolei]
MSDLRTERPSLGLALLPIVLTLGVLGVQLFYYKDFTPHVPLAIGLAITAAIGWLQGHRWQQMEQGVLRIVSIGLQSIAILIVVGMIIGTWIASGTVPYIIHAGLNLLTPQWFLAAGMLLCSLVSVSLGTSWGTTGTVGLALMGIGAGFDIPPYWTAGAVVSGAFFGDKVSPLSDTTNLAPAVTGVGLFDHIRNMMPTTIPSMLIAFAIYLVAGFSLIGGQAVDFSKVEMITTGIEKHFTLSWTVLLPAALVLFLALRKMPAIPSLFAGAIAGALVAMVVQGASVHDVFAYMQDGYKLESGVKEIDSLLNRGGIQSMTWVITLVMIALGFGGALEHTRCLEVIVDAMLKRTRRFGSMQAAATGTAIATNLVAGDPYLSIALPGRMYAPAYRGKGYSTLNLSRALEEGGTLVSPLVPWNAGGAIVITALGLGVAEGNFQNLLYIPLSFACWLSPVIGIFYGYMGWFSPRASAAEKARWHADGEAIQTFEHDEPIGGLKPSPAAA